MSHGERPSDDMLAVRQLRGQRQEQHHETARPASRSNTAQPATRRNCAAGRAYPEPTRRARHHAGGHGPAHRLFKGYLSRIENGKKTPSLSTLGRIALALATDVHTLLVEPPQHEGEPFFRVLRKEDRRRVERAESAFGYHYQALGLTGAGARMAPFIAQLPREIDRHVFFEHDGEEIVYLLSGRGGVADRP